MASGSAIPQCGDAKDVAMQKPVTGYEFWFQRRPDYRTPAKSNK
jgi:hypothetical protein